MSQSSYISRRSSSRLADYSDLTLTTDATTSGATSGDARATPTPRGSATSAKVQYLSTTNDLLAERMSTLQVPPSFVSFSRFFTFCSRSGSPVLFHVFMSRLHVKGLCTVCMCLQSRKTHTQEGIRKPSTVVFVDHP